MDQVGLLISCLAASKVLENWADVFRTIELTGTTNIYNSNVLSCACMERLTLPRLLIMAFPRIDNFAAQTDDQSQSSLVRIPTS